MRLFGDLLLIRVGQDGWRGARVTGRGGRRGGDDEREHDRRRRDVVETHLMPPGSPVAVRVRIGENSVPGEPISGYGRLAFGKDAASRGLSAEERVEVLALFVGPSVA